MIHQINKIMNYIQSKVAKLTNLSPKYTYAKVDDYHFRCAKCGAFLPKKFIQKDFKCKKCGLEVLFIWK